MEVNQDYDQTQWVEKFKDANGQFELALDTYLIIGAKGDYYFKFEGTTIRWVNGNKEIAPVIVVPIVNGDNYIAEQELARRFLSQLSYQLDIGINEITCIGSGNKRIKPFLTQPYHYGGLLVQEPYFDEIKHPSKRQKLALALYREGKGSPNSHYKFLVFYKVIEIVSGKRIGEWIEKHLDTNRIYALDKWIKKLPPGRKPAQFLKQAHRHAIAHVDEFLSSGDPTLDPDDLTQRAQLNESIDIVTQLAKIAMKEILPA